MLLLPSFCASYAKLRGKDDRITKFQFLGKLAKKKKKKKEEEGR
jgi:hypothetical protein